MSSSALASCEVEVEDGPELGRFAGVTVMEMACNDDAEEAAAVGAVESVSVAHSVFMGDAVDFDVEEDAEMADVATSSNGGCAVEVVDTVLSGVTAGSEDVSSLLSHGGVPVSPFTNNESSVPSSPFSFFTRTEEVFSSSSALEIVDFGVALSILSADEDEEEDEEAEEAENEPDVLFEVLPPLAALPTGVEAMALTRALGGSIVDEAAADVMEEEDKLGACRCSGDGPERCVGDEAEEDEDGPAWTGAPETPSPAFSEPRSSSETGGRDCAVGQSDLR